MDEKKIEYNLDEASKELEKAERILESMVGRTEILMHVSKAASRIVEAKKYL